MSPQHLYQLLEEVAFDLPLENKNALPSEFMHLL
jgi:hypothetical protein